MRVYQDAEKGCIGMMASALDCAREEAGERGTLLIAFPLDLKTPLIEMVDDYTDTPEFDVLAIGLTTGTAKYKGADCICIFTESPKLPTIKVYDKAYCTGDPLYDFCMFLEEDFYSGGMMR